MNAALLHVEPENPKTNVDGSWYEFRRGPYRSRLAVSQADHRAVFRLRFAVFNLELNEGLDSAYLTGHDTDEFDSYCDHLLVEETLTGQVVGTYRLQTGAVARANRGFYSEREFDFVPYAPLESQLMELGRACIHRDHRSTQVLNLLWHGILHYGLRFRVRYLIGCCSLSSQNPAEGTAVYKSLEEHRVKPEFLTAPRSPFAMELVNSKSTNPEIPKLLRTYLALGAKICGPPAIDREFKTIDFLTLLDLDTLHPRIRTRLMKA